MTSFTQVDAAQLMNACEVYFKLREGRIQKAREDFIENRMNPTTKILGIFPRKPYTREQAEKAWETETVDGFMTHKDEANEEGCIYAEHVMELMDLATNSVDGKVMVSSKMISVMQFNR